MIFIRVALIAGYLFWGGMFLYAFSELMMKNAWVNLFEINYTSPKSVEIKALNERSVEIQYEFESEGKIYQGKESVINEIASKLPNEEKKIIVAYNSKFPNTNYLEQLDFKTRGGNVGMVISCFFLIFLAAIDVFSNKKKWLKIYGIEK